MKIKFDKSCKCVCKYISEKEWYKVVEEGKSTYKIVDSSGDINAYPKTWVKEVDPEE